MILSSKKPFSSLNRFFAMCRVCFEFYPCSNCIRSCGNLYFSFKNRLLIISVILSSSMLVAVIYWPPLATLFHTYPLHLRDWLIAIGLGVTIFPIVEITKWIIRRKGRYRQHLVTGA